MKALPVCYEGHSEYKTERTFRTKTALMEWVKEASIDAKIEMSGDLAYIPRPNKDAPQEDRDVYHNYIRKRASGRTKAKDIFGKGYYQVVYTLTHGKVRPHPYLKDEEEVEEYEYYTVDNSRKAFEQSILKFSTEDNEKVPMTDYAIIGVGYEHIEDGAPTDTKDIKTLNIRIDALCRTLSVTPRRMS